MKFVIVLNIVTCITSTVTALLHPFKEYSAEECPPNYERRGNSCIRQGSVPEQELCPHGSFDHYGQCVLITPALLSCQQGTLINDEWCKILDETNGQVLCPDGSEQHGDKCIIKTSIKACAEGTAQIDADQCAKIEPKIFFCPDGFTNAGDVCVARDIRPPMLVCPEGTILIDGNCVIEIGRPKVCPKGAADEGRQCAFYFPPVIRCPNDYEEQDGTCIQISKVPADIYCPDGSTLVNHECQRLIPLDETEVCPDGVLVGNVCVVSTSVPVSYKCPPNYTMQDSKLGTVCVTTITYDCSHTRYECDPNKDKDLRLNINKKDPTDLIHLRHLENEKEAEGVHDIIPTSIHQFHDYCHKIAVVTPKTCQKESTADPIPFCSEGVYDGKNSCDLQIKIRPELKCEGMIDDKGNCVMQEKTHPFIRCPEGTVHEHHKCKRIIFASPNVSCPPDTQFITGQCATLVDKQCPSRGCEETVTVAIPQYICDIDYTLEANGKTDCVKTQYAAKLTKCPSGTHPVDDVTCAKITRIISFDNDENVVPTFTCPIGFYSKGTECLSLTYQQPLRNCPQGYELKYNACFKEQEPILDCPKGSSQSPDGRCIIDWNVDPLHVDTPIMKSPNPLPINFGTPKLPPIPELPKTNVILPTISKKTIPIDVGKTLPINTLSKFFNGWK